MAGVSEVPGGRRAGIAILLAAWAAFMFPVFAGKVRFPVALARDPAGASVSNPETGDAFYYTYPLRSYLGASLREGRVPLWDPHRFAGTPFAAASLNGVFYPPNWLYAAGGFLAVYTLIAAASVAVGLAGMFWLLRMLGLHGIPAALGAATFMLSGFFTGWAAHDTVVGSTIWLPLGLCGIELARRGRRRRGIALGGGAMAMGVLAGHPQFFLYSWLAYGIWAAVSAGALARTDRAGALKLFGAATAGAAAAVAVAGIMVVPALELSGFVVRQEAPYSHVVHTGMRAEGLAGFVLPDYLGNPMDGNYRGWLNWTSAALYPGVAALVLAPAAMLGRRRRALAAFGVTGALALLWAFGTPAYRVIYELVPGISRTSALVRFTFLIDFAAAGLAALGLDALMSRPRRRGLGASIGAAAAAAGAGAVALAALGPGTTLEASYLWPQAGRALVLLGAAAAAALLVLRGTGRVRAWAAAGVAVVAVADLWLAGFRMMPFERPGNLDHPGPAGPVLAALPGERPRIALWGEWWLPYNSALVRGLYSLHGYDPQILAAYVDLISAASEQHEDARFNFVRPLEAGALDAPVLDLLGVRAVLGPGNAPEGEGVVHRGVYTVLARPGGAPAAFLVRCWEVADAARAAARAGAMSRSELMGTAVVEAAPPGLAPPGPDCPGGGHARVRRYSAERIEVSVEAAGDSLLVVPDSWYPGWRASVDGREAPVMRAFGALRAVPVPSGSREVVMDFEPESLRTGALLTLAGLGVLALMIVPLPGRSVPVGAAPLDGAGQALVEGNGRLPAK